MKEEEQSGYYQAIAREFLRRRGAPLILSPRDLDVIAAWEERHVPLDVVLEGIGRAFDGIRDKSRGTRGLPLSFCEGQVSRALAQHRDRRAGRRKPAAPRAGKSAKARKEVEAFLASLPPEDDDLRRLFEAAAAALSESPPDEDVLEHIDEGVNGVLWGRASRDIHGPSRGETDAASRTALLKALRVRRKIPYVSLYYY
jgi:hypothetical protein